MVRDEPLFLEDLDSLEGSGADGVQLSAVGLADYVATGTGGTLGELDDALVTDVGGFNVVGVEAVGRLETREVRLKQFQGVAGVEQCSALGRHLFVGGVALVDFVREVFLGDFVDGQLVDGGDGVVVDVLVGHHLLVVVRVGEDDVLRVALTGSPLDLDVGLETEGSIK